MKTVRAYKKQRQNARLPVRLSCIAVKTSADRRTVSRLAGRIWNEHYVPLIGRKQVDYRLARFQSPAAVTAQTREGYKYYLLRSGRTYIGYLAVIARPREQILFISKLYVRSSRRGLGFGAQAVAFIERLARRRCLGRLALTVNRHNIGSQRFYRRCGFVRGGSIRTDIGEGFVMDDFRMEKTL